MVRSGVVGITTSNVVVVVGIVVVVVGATVVVVVRAIVVVVVSGSRSMKVELVWTGVSVGGGEASAELLRTVTSPLLPETASATVTPAATPAAMAARIAGEMFMLPFSVRDGLR